MKRFALTINAVAAFLNIGIGLLLLGVDPILPLGLGLATLSLVVVPGWRPVSALALFGALALLYAFVFALTLGEAGLAPAATLVLVLTGILALRNYRRGGAQIATA